MFTSMLCDMQKDVSPIQIPIKQFQRYKCNMNKRFKCPVCINNCELKGTEAGPPLNRSNICRPSNEKNVIMVSTHVMHVFVMGVLPCRLRMKILNFIPQICKIINSVQAY